MKKVILMLVVAILSACNSTNSKNELGYTVYQDKFNNTARYAMLPAGSLAGTPFLSVSEMYIDMFADVKDRAISLNLSIILNFEAWVFINSGKSLVLMVDGKPIELISPEGSSGNRGILGGLHGAVAGTRIREEAIYPITVDQIKTLAHANKVELRVYGRNQTVTRELTTDHISSIKSFYVNYIIANQIKSF